MLAALPASEMAEPRSPPRATKGLESIRIDFLLNDTAPDDLGGRFPVRDNMNPSPTEGDDKSISESRSPSIMPLWSDSKMDSEHYDIFIGADLAYHDAIFDTLGTAPFSAPEPYDLSPPVLRRSSDATFQALDQRAFEIQSLLKGALRTCQYYSMPSSQFTSQQDLVAALEWISSIEIDTCVNSFFRNHYRHCPIIHQSSFSAATAPVPLVLSLIALGGMYLRDTAKSKVKALLDLMEHFIFSQQTIQELQQERTDREDMHVDDDEKEWFRFQTFQGAYLMVVVQSFSGNMTARRRARREKFLTVLTVRDQSCSPRWCN